jgi:hypothetical protein
MSCIIILLIIILILLSIWGIWEVVKYVCNCKKELYKTEELKNIKMNRLNNIDGVNGIEHSSGEEGINKINIPEKNFFLPFSDNQNIDKQLSIVNSFKNVLYKDAFIFFSLNKILDKDVLETQQSFDNNMDYRVPVIADDINQPSVGIKTRYSEGISGEYNGVMDFCVLDLQDFNAVNEGIYNNGLSSISILPWRGKGDYNYFTDTFLKEFEANVVSDDFVRTTAGGSSIEEKAIWFKDKLNELSRSPKLLDIIFGKEMQTIQADGKYKNFSNNINLDNKTPGFSSRNLPLTYISNSTKFPDNVGCPDNIAVADNNNRFFATQLVGVELSPQNIRQIRVQGDVLEDVNKISKMQYGKLTLPPFTYSLMIGVDNIRNVKNALLVSNMKPTYLLEGNQALNDSIYLPSYYLTTLGVYRSNAIDNEWKSLEESDVDYNNWNNKLLNNNFLPYEKIRPFNTYVITKDTRLNAEEKNGLKITRTQDTKDNWFFGAQTVSMCGQEISNKSPYNITTVQNCCFDSRLTEIKAETCNWFEKIADDIAVGWANSYAAMVGVGGASSGCFPEREVELDIYCIDYRLLPPYMSKSGWYNYMFKWNDVYEFNIQETVSQNVTNFLPGLYEDDREIMIEPTIGSEWTDIINSVVVADCIPVYLFLKYLYREFILPDVETYSFDVKKFIEKEGPGVIDKYFLYKPGSVVNEINYEKSVEMFTKMYNSPHTQFDYFSYINLTPEVLNYVNTSITFNTSVSIENVLYPYVNDPEMRNNAISLNILFTQLSDLYYTLVAENLIIRPTTNLPFAFPFRREDFIELAFNSMTNISELDMPDYNYYIDNSSVFSGDTEVLDMPDYYIDNSLKIYDYFRDELSKGSSSNEEWTNRLMLWYDDNIKKFVTDVRIDNTANEFKDLKDPSSAVNSMKNYLRDSKESVNNFVYFIKNTEFLTTTDESPKYVSNFNSFSKIKLFYNGILNFISDNLEYPFFLILDYMFRNPEFPYTRNSGNGYVDFINFRDIFGAIEKVVVIFRREKSYQLTVDYATSVLNCYINLSFIQQSSLEFVSDNGYKSFINDSTFNKEETIYEKVLLNTENPIDSFPKLSCRRG